jgi:penicillin-binding protein-related factor A (putative recombinase)
MQHLTGAEFEALIVEQNQAYEKERIACIGRYGVIANHIMNRETGKMEIIPLASLPDFEGVVKGGQHIVFDAKVCSAASFSWARYRSETRGARARQLKHMLRRSRFGAMCGFLMHWNGRSLKTKTVDAKTYFIPVHAEQEYWSQVDCGQVKSLTLDGCDIIGKVVEWTVRGASRKPRPDFLDTILSQQEIFQEG